jgi:hypothetical protein
MATHLSGKSPFYLTLQSTTASGFSHLGENLIHIKQFILETDK